MSSIIPSSNWRAYVKATTFYDNVASGSPAADPVHAIAAGDALRLSKCDIKQRIVNALRPDERNTFRTQVSTYAGLHEATFDLEGILGIQGTAGTAPEMDDLLEHILGNKVVDPGVSVTYKPRAIISVDQPKALTILRHHYSDGAEFLVNGVIETAAFNFVNGELATISGSGVGAYGGTLGFTGATAPADAVAPYTFDVPGEIHLESLRRWIGNKIEFYDYTLGTTDNNGGAGYTLVSVEAALTAGNTTVTVAEAIVGSANPVFVRAFLPAPTLVNSIIPSGPVGIQITFGNLSADNFPAKSVEITIAKNNMARREGGFSGVSQAYCAGFEASTRIEFVADGDNEKIAYVAKNLALSNQGVMKLEFDAFQDRYFAATGNRLHVTMPQIALTEIPEWTDNENDARGLVIAGRLLNSSGATENDALQLKFL